MKTVGIVAEYNPFHNGHILQIREIRRRFPAARIVVVMSGSFTQRGSVAILDKWTRAASAVRHGVSLVLELPTVFATRSAQYFAGGGVRLLDRLGVIDVLAFGSEYDDLSLLSRLSREIDTNETTDTLRKALREGASYAAALTGKAGSDAVIRHPNVILAVEYLRALKRYDSALMPLPTPRFSASHNDRTLPSDGKHPVASASAIRSALSAPDTRDTALPFVPADMAASLSDHLADTSRLLRPILSRLLTASQSELADVAGVDTGLERRLRRSALSSHSYQELIESASSKRYHHARIRRLLFHLLLGLSDKTARRLEEEGPLYARPLAFDDKGRDLLRAIEDNARLPIVTKPARFLAKKKPLSPAHEMLSLDIRATALSSLTTDPVGSPSANADYLISPVYLPA